MYQGHLEAMYQYSVDRSHLASLDLIDPPTAPPLLSIRPTSENNARVLQKVQVLSDRLLEIRKRQEIQRLSIDPTSVLLAGQRPLAKLVPHRTPGDLVGEVQHAAARVLYEQDLPGSQELLADDDAAQGVARRSARVADHVGVAEGDAEGGARVDPGVHAGYFWGWGISYIGVEREREVVNLRVFKTVEGEGSALLPIVHDHLVNLPTPSCPLQQRDNTKNDK